MPSGRPGENEYAPFYARYVSLTSGEDAIAALEKQAESLRAFAVPGERESFRYASGKWSVRQVIGHLVDGERVFGYRAFCISRGEQAALPTFDENVYVAESRYDEIPVPELQAELVALRETNLVALRRLEPAAWRRTGTASGKPVTVRALGFVMAGHILHHFEVLRDRYGIA